MNERMTGKKSRPTKQTQTEEYERNTFKMLSMEEAHRVSGYTNRSRSLYIYMLANTRYAQFKWRMEASDAQNKYDLMSDELENISVESTKTEDSLQNNTKWSYSKCI